MSQEEKLKNMLVNFQSGDADARKELVVQFTPLVRKLSHTLNENVCQEDLAQELWVEFLQFAQKFDVTKVKYFPACMAQQLRWKRMHLLRSLSKQHEVEGRSLDSVEEEGCEYTYDDLWKEDFIKLLKKAGCTKRRIEVAISFTEDMTPGEQCRKLGLTQPSLSKYRKWFKALIVSREEISTFLKK